LSSVIVLQAKACVGFHPRRWSPETS